MRNLALKVPTDLWLEFKARVAACYQAPSRTIARELASGIRADYAATLPSAVSCFEDDLEACIAHLRLPVTHRRSTRRIGQSLSGRGVPVGRSIRRNDPDCGRISEHTTGATRSVTRVS